MKRNRSCLVRNSDASLIFFCFCVTARKIVKVMEQNHNDRKTEIGRTLPKFLERATVRNWGCLRHTNQFIGLIGSGVLVSVQIESVAYSFELTH